MTLNTQIRPFMDKDFLLTNETARALYHDYASGLPIIDYHNHLPPDEVAGNRAFDNLTQIWLAGDHYKWRAMRAAGVSEEYITGPASDADKFQKWGDTVPLTLRNPLFHWTHLELRRYFGLQDLLNAETAGPIYKRANEMLQQPEFRTQPLLRKMKVEHLCTTDDPADSLEHHEAFAGQEAGFRMLPAFRPDRSIAIQKDTFSDYLRQLGAAADIEIKTFTQLCDALLKRIAFFHERGCRLADHGLSVLHIIPCTAAEADRILQKRLQGQELSPEGTAKYQTALLELLGQAYHRRDWVMQLHLGALRNNSQRAFRQLGPDTGFDSIGDWNQAEGLSAFLSLLDNNGRLPRTILYNLNPRDNELFATMAGNFNDGSGRGKVQYGAAWWFLDQKNGIEKQLNSLSNMGLLSCFIGMLTDSRSFLSFPRHEYFRRVLCNLIGEDVHRGELPHDLPWLGKVVSDICYHNAKTYFNI